jgi:protein-tyrosine-phosphatase
MGSAEPFYFQAAVGRLTFVMKRILFVCIENSNRSQMAEAFVRMEGRKEIEAFSAGSKPSGKVNLQAIASMKELGYNLDRHHSKSLEEVNAYAPFDVVVTMGCGDACAWMPAKKFIDWHIPDPKNLPPGEFNKVRNLIRQKVSALVKALS